MTELERIEVCVETVLRKEFVVRPHFDHFAVSHRDDAVGIDDGGEPVRDHEGRAAHEERIERALNVAFAFRIERARRFVEKEDRRVLQERAGDRYALALPESSFPAAPTRVSSPSGRLSTNSVSAAASTARSISSRVAFRIAP